MILKTTKYIVVATIFTFSTFKLAIGQNLNQPFYDIGKTIHFGFTFGSNATNFHYELSPLFYQFDSLDRINIKSFPGLHFGGVFNYHMGNNFDFRVIPTLVLTHRRIVYSLHDQSRTEEKKIESTFIELPVHIKFKSDRVGNTRLYVLSGGKYSYDMESKFDAARDIHNPMVIIAPNNFYYEYGVGLDLYFPNFKFTPEIKIGHGLNNILVPDPHNSFHTNIFDRLRSRIIMFSLYFE